MKIKVLGPLNPSPPTCAITVTSAPTTSTLSTASVAFLPMNSASLQDRMSAPRNSRPQSSTTPSDVMQSIHTTTAGRVDETFGVDTTGRSSPARMSTAAVMSASDRVYGIRW